MAEIHHQVVNATKWATASELAYRLVSPISSMILARLLAPEAFGVMVTALMVISFAEIFTDAGFQKYIIQHDFPTRDDLHRSTNVAFWSNFILSIIIWTVVIIFAQPIATLVGNPGRGDVIAVSCACIPIAAFSSIQMALFKRDFDFKTLFWVRVVGSMMPIVVTVPLAFLTRSYWALIIGMLAQNIVNAVLLTWKSTWRPRLEYSFNLFREMFAFTMWTMLESILNWVAGYGDMFIVGTILSQAFLGMYRTTMAIVGQILGIIIAATIPVLYTALSKLQNDDEQLRRVFYQFQRVAALALFPVGVGMFVFRQLITDILLGDQWAATAWFIGIWSLSIAIMAVLSNFSSELYRAKARPKLSAFAQFIYLLFLIPTVYYFAKYTYYHELCTARSLIRFVSIPIDFILLYIIVRIKPLKILSNIWAPTLISVLMGCLGIALLNLGAEIWKQIIYIIVCAGFYIGVILLIPSERQNAIYLKNLILKRK